MIDKSQSTPLGVGVGVCAGCFAGAGYGLVVGMGRVTQTRAGALVVPGTRPFASNGPVTGVFCGVAFGAAAGTMIAQGPSFRTKIHIHPYAWNLSMDAARRSIPAAISATVRRGPERVLGLAGWVLRVRPLVGSYGTNYLRAVFASSDVASLFNTNRRRTRKLSDSKPNLTSTENHGENKPCVATSNLFNPRNRFRRNLVSVLHDASE